MKYYSDFSDGTIGCIVRLNSQLDFKMSDWVNTFEGVIQQHPILNMGIGTCDSADPQGTSGVLYFKVNLQTLVKFLIGSRIFWF